MPKSTDETVTEVTSEVISELPEGHVKARITKFGHNKVHTGNRLSVYEEEYFKQNDDVILPKEIAQALEDRQFVEIYE